MRLFALTTAGTFAFTLLLAACGGGDRKIVIELFSDTPVTTNNFVFLACKGFYDGLTFHRVEPDFVIQGGDPEGTGRGDPGYSIPDEDDGDHQMELGVISMAKSGPDTAGSQFFIVTGPRESVQHLDPDFTVFGRVTEGMDVAQEIAVGDVMQTVSIEEGGDTGGEPSAAFAGCQKTDEEQFAAPEQVTDPSKTYTATISIEK